MYGNRAKNNFFSEDCIKLKHKDVEIGWFVRNMLILQHRFAMLDLKTRD